MTPPSIESDDHDHQTLLQLVAAAADLCMGPARHAVRFRNDNPINSGDGSDCCLVIEARDASGNRLDLEDLELEIYRSGDDLNLMLTPLHDQAAPLLWHGSHPVWMLPDSGERCPRPNDGAALEGLCRRLRALLVTG